jgi:hypothetical protein
MVMGPTPMFQNAMPMCQMFQGQCKMCCDFFMTSNTNQTDCTKCVQLHKLTNENDDLKERVKKLENLLDEKSLDRIIESKVKPAVSSAVSFNNYFSPEDVPEDEVAENVPANCPEFNCWQGSTLYIFINIKIK